MPILDSEFCRGPSLELAVTLLRNYESTAAGRRGNVRAVEDARAIVRTAPLAVMLADPRFDADWGYVADLARRVAAGEFGQPTAPPP